MRKLQYLLEELQYMLEGGDPRLAVAFLAAQALLVAVVIVLLV